MFHPIVEGMEHLREAKSDLYRWWRTTFHLAAGKAPLERHVKLSEACPQLHPMGLDFVAQSKHSICLSRSGEELLELLEIDAVLNFSTFILQGCILETFPHGIWSFHHGNPLEYRGSPPGFWEIFDNSPRSGAVLQRLGEKLDDGELLRSIDLPTVSHNYCAQRQALFAASINWPAEVAREVIATGGVKPQAPSERSTSPVKRRPSDGQLLRFLGPYLKAKLRYQLEI